MSLSVAIAGATGNLGPAILKALIEADIPISVTVLTRAGSKFSVPPGLDDSKFSVIEVDYTTPESIKPALAGVTHCISALPAIALDVQTRLIDACVLAQVGHFIPSEFGLDFMNPMVKAIPTMLPKTTTDEHLEKLRSDGKIEYTLIQVGAFLDWGLASGMLLDPKNKKAELWNGGNSLMSLTTLPTIGHAVLKTVTGETQGKRILKIQNIGITQRRLLELAQEVVGFDGWEISTLDVEARVKLATEKLYSGTAELEDFLSFIKKGLSSTEDGCWWKKDDDDLLGIERYTEDRVKDLIKAVVS